MSQYAILIHDFNASVETSNGTEWAIKGPYDYDTGYQHMLQLCRDLNYQHGFEDEDDHKFELALEESTRQLCIHYSDPDSDLTQDRWARLLPI